MGIGNRIKEARNNLGYTQEELAKLLGVTKGAVANYENETSHPKEPIMYKLIETLKVDANYLFQDCVKLPNDANDVTLSEYEHIKKYRFITKYSPNGTKTVDMILDREYSIAIEQKEQKENAKLLFGNPDYAPLFNSDTKIEPEKIGFIKELLDKINKNQIKTDI